MSLLSAPSSQSSQIETVQCHQYTVKIYDSAFDAVHGGGEKVREIFVPPPYSLCFSKLGSFFADGPRNVFKENPFSDDAEIEHPLTEIQIPRNVLDRVKTIVELKLKIQIEETAVNAQMQQYWG